MDVLRAFYAAWWPLPGEDLAHRLREEDAVTGGDP